MNKVKKTFGACGWKREEWEVDAFCRLCNALQMSVSFDLAGISIPLTTLLQAMVSMAVRMNAGHSLVPKLQTCGRESCRIAARRIEEI